MNTKIERIAYAGWPNCFRMTNGEIELIVTSDVGPRILHCGVRNGQNFFCQFEDQLGKSGEDSWQIRGGHRLWAAPEIIPDTYALDNSPVRVTQSADFLSLLQPVEPETGLRKEISIRIEDSGEIVVTHRIENTGSRARELSAWALSVMAPGGIAIVPFPSRASHERNLLPTNPLVMWAYTDFSDPRWKLTTKYLILKQDRTASTPQKAGLYNTGNFAAYLLNGECFSKRSETNRNGRYPDFHCSCEVFTNAEFLELETLGSLVSIKPDSSIAHVEHWFLHRDVQIPDLTDAEIDRVLGPVVNETARIVAAWSV